MFTIPQLITNHWRAKAFGLLAIATLALATPVTTRAYHDGECHPNQPNCLPNGEHKLNWDKPEPGLGYHLAERAHLWVDAWRSYHSFKPWAQDTYDPAYVYPETFIGNFKNQCQNSDDWDWYVNGIPEFESKAGRYQWSVNDVVVASAADCSGVQLTFHGEGIHDVKLEVFHHGASTPYLTKTEDVRVRDYLIVLFGDSASSGEGSPDLQRGPLQEWGTWTDRRCHRSEQAGVPRAVMELEKSDPHSTVTFLNFACSGATISLHEEGKGAGILAPYAGIEPPSVAVYDPDEPQLDYKSHFLPSQVDQLKNALFCPDGQVGGRAGYSGCVNEQPLLAREVDALFMTGGINDVQFATLMLACTLEDNCHNKISDFYDNPADGMHLRTDEELESFADRIPDRYVDFKEVMDWKGIHVDQTFVLEYPNAFTDQNGNLCGEIVEDVLPGTSIWALLYLAWPTLPVNFSLIPYLAQELHVDAGDIYDILWDAMWGDLKVDDKEVKWMNDFGTPTLNGAVETGVEDVNLNYPDANFHFVGGIANAFFGHGYCSSSNWIRRATESSNRQGPWNFVSKPLTVIGPVVLSFGIQAETKGLMHPTDDGYKAIAKVLKPVMAEFKNHAPIAKNDSYKLNTASETVLDTGGFGEGVMLNDYDPDGDPVRSKITKDPANGTATLTEYGRLIYTPDSGYYGTDWLEYEVSDGAAADKARVYISVGNSRYQPPTWKWNYPTGTEMPVAEIGGIAEFPICNKCGDMVLRVDPEVLPRYGRMTFQLDKDRWIGRYTQNGLVPATLPDEDYVMLELGRIILGVFQREGRAEVPVRIVGDAPPPAWSWIFRSPEPVLYGSTTQFDLCDNCQDYEVRVTVEPESGSVEVRLDPERNRWVAVYTHDPASELTGDGFGVVIGQVSGDLFLPIDSTRVSLSIGLGN